MPDLSEMLGAVYGGSDEETAPAEPTDGPEWADDDQLDRAFAEWTPGPSADAPAAERSMFAPAPDAPPRLADDLAAALSEAVLAKADPEPQATDDEDEDEQEDHETAVIANAAVMGPASLADLEPEAPAPIPMPVHKAGWQRSDDDIIPTGRSGRGRGVRAPRPSLSRSPKGQKVSKAPKGEKTPKAEKPKGKGLKREISFSFGKKK